LNRQLGLLLLLGACVAACAGPGLFGSDQRTLVRLYDADTGVRLELANQSHPDYRDLYSHPRSEANLKLAPDELLESLLDRLDDLNFDRLSAPGGPPDQAALLGWLEVSDGSQTRTFAVPRSGATREQLSSFAQMQLAVSDTFTHVTGLQYIDNPKGADLFRKQPAAQPAAGAQP
jgi:hypothetical protein